MQNEIKWKEIESKMKQNVSENIFWWDYIKRFGKCGCIQDEKEKYWWLWMHIQFVEGKIKMMRIRGN